jgi:hypothetical protein
VAGVVAVLEGSSPCADDDPVVDVVALTASTLQETTGGSVLFSEKKRQKGMAQSTDERSGNTLLERAQRMMCVLLQKTELQKNKARMVDETDINVLQEQKVLCRDGVISLS